MSEELRDAVRAVLQAARVWREREYDEDAGDMEGRALAHAVDALEQLLPPWDEYAYEGPMPWAKVIAGDEALGATGSYYKILNVWSTGPTVVVDIEVNGKAKRYTKDGPVETTVRRRMTPEAVALATLERAGLDITTVLSEGT